MVLGTKYYYETIEQVARIRFFDDDVLVSEWVASNGIGPTVTIPISPGITLLRTLWKDAEANEGKWIKGMENAGIFFPENREPASYSLEVIKSGDTINFEYKVNDTSDVEYAIREMSYDVTTDEVTIEPRTAGAVLHWVDYKQYLYLRAPFKENIDAFYRYHI